MRCYNSGMTKQTLKGHGSPTQLMFFGSQAKPRPQGILVTVVTGDRGQYKLINAGRNNALGYVAAFNSASKFWAETI